MKSFVSGPWFLTFHINLQNMYRNGGVYCKQTHTVNVEIDPNICTKFCLSCTHLIVTLRRPSLTFTSDFINHTPLKSYLTETQLYTIGKIVKQLLRIYNASYPFVYMIAHQVCYTKTHYPPQGNVCEKPWFTPTTKSPGRIKWLHIWFWLKTNYFICLVFDPILMCTISFSCFTILQLHIPNQLNNHANPKSPYCYHGWPPTQSHQIIKICQKW